MAKEKKKFKAEIKRFYKNMGIYIVHRTYEKDHKKGRPAILLKYKSQTSLVWCGTHKKEENSDEIPLVIKINKIKTYFYSKGIEKVNNIDIKGVWTNYKTNSIYELSNSEQKELISTFVQYTNQNDPYQKIIALELENEMLKKEKQKYFKEQEFEYEIH